MAFSTTGSAGASPHLKEQGMNDAWRWGDAPAEPHIPQAGAPLKPKESRRRCIRCNELLQRRLGRSLARVFHGIIGFLNWVWQGMKNPSSRDRAPQGLSSNSPFPEWVN
jgi:hypothetical protein